MTGEERILVPIPRNPTAQDFFKLYITDQIIDRIVVQTNIYAQQFIEQHQYNLRPHSLVHQWKATDRAEILTLLAVVILMGGVHKPRFAMYWSTDSLISTPIFSQIISRDRFLILMRFLHFLDNNNINLADPVQDKLYKVREVVNMIEESCFQVFSPGKDVSIDESLVPFKGRLSFQQYIKSKRARFGIKLYQLCTSNGILLDFIVYHGNIAPLLIEMEERALITERIPATLMERYFSKGHNLYIDNFYTSLRLAKYLIENGTNVTGTVRENRKQFSPELKNTILHKGEAAFYQHDSIVIVKYRAKMDSARGQPQVVYVLSMSHGAAMKNTNRVDTDGNVIQKPTIIIDYNHNMGGVDLVDQQLDSLDVLRKSYKWYKKLFLRLVMQCALASHKLYKKQRGKDDFLFFLQDVCTLFLQNAPRLERNPSRVAIDNIARLTGRNHWSVKRETPEEWKAMKSKNQKMQSVSGKRKTHKEWKTHKNNLGLQGMSRETRTLCGRRML